MGLSAAQTRIQFTAEIDSRSVIRVGRFKKNYFKNVLVQQAAKYRQCDGLATKDISYNLSPKM